MDKLIVVALVCVAAVVVAFVVRRKAPTAPTPDGPDHVPTRLDLADLGSPREPWIVVLFSSATCDSCADVRSKVAILASDHVAIREVTYQDDPALHRKYAIDAVPMCLVLDASGAVRRSFVGSVSSTHLWGAVAGLRDPSSVPDECGTGQSDSGAGGVDSPPDT